jgi:DNA-binding transcriptional MerR regulator
MKSLSDVLREGQINYATLVKYTTMGLLPKPMVEHKGHRGARSYYPDEIIGMIHWIETLKARGFTLAAIAKLFKEKDVLGEQEIALSAKSNSDPLLIFMKLGEEVERKYPGRDVVHAEGKVERSPDGDIVVMTQVTLTPKPKEAL